MGGSTCQEPETEATATEESLSTTTESASTTKESASTTTESLSTPAGPTTPATECSCGVPNRPNRIVGGVVTEVNEYPWQVGLVSSSSTRPYCGGSILSSRTILTAAHCTAGDVASSITVVVAEHDWTVADGELRFSVCSKTEHPAYESSTVDYDFSILTLCSDISFTQDASPVCLPTQPGSAYDGVLATVSGWGTLVAGGSQPAQLMEVDVTTLTNPACNAAYGAGSITESMICATTLGKDACQGDSGGGLLYILKLFLLLFLRTSGDQRDR